MIDQMHSADVATPAAGIPVPAGRSGFEVTGPMLVALAGAALGAVGSLLPWAKVDLLLVQAQASGIDTTDGVVTLIMSVGVGICALLLSTSVARGLGVAAALAGVVVALIAAYNIGHYYELRNDGDLRASLVTLEPGIYITAAGGVVAAIGGAMAAVSRR